MRRTFDKLPSCFHTKSRMAGLNEWITTRVINYLLFGLLINAGLLLFGLSIGAELVFSRLVAEGKLSCGT